MSELVGYIAKDFSIMDVKIFDNYFLLISNKYDLKFDRKDFDNIKFLIDSNLDPAHINIYVHQLSEKVGFIFVSIFTSYPIKEGYLYKYDYVPVKLKNILYNKDNEQFELFIN
jgi:hypothetical protein